MRSASSWTSSRSTTSTRAPSATRTRVSRSTSASRCSPSSKWYGGAALRLRGRKCGAGSCRKLPECCHVSQGRIPEDPGGTFLLTSRKFCTRICRNPFLANSFGWDAHPSPGLPLQPNLGSALFLFMCIKSCDFCIPLKGLWMPLWTTLCV